MCDLGDTINAIVEAGVVAVDEDEHAFAMVRHGRGEGRAEIVDGEIDRREIRRRIAWVAVLGALDRADLVVLRHGHAHTGKGEHFGSLAAEDDALILVLVAGGGDEDVVLGGDAGRRRRRGIGGQKLVLAFADAAGDRQRERHDKDQL